MEREDLKKMMRKMNTGVIGQKKEKEREKRQMGEVRFWK